MMVNVLSSIRLAVCAFPLLAAPVAVPFFCRQMRARCFNWVRAVFGGLFLFYVLCVLALVFFPLPDAAQAAKLTTYDAQLVPFQFVADFLRETPLVRSDARTYLPALFDRTVQQVVCNILMLMPFGMYLRYVCGLDLGRVALVSLAFSAFIELGQLTGLFFLFRGSYRLCDVDDLMLNTLGGLLGGELVRALDGQAVFYSHYTSEAFLSRAAMPVMSGGKTVGAVYVCESDSERAALIGSIQRRLATITIGIGAAALVVLWFSIKMLTRRITQLADGVRTVQRGDYSFRLTLAGDDELTELGREFNNLTERLETTEAQRRRFVSDASHELKTPLASIRLLSDSISQSADMDSETMREFVTDIGSEAERLQRTTEKLLDLSRRDDGVQSDVTVVDLQQAVHGTLHLLRPLAAKSDVTLTCLMSDGVTVRASEDDIYHIVFNLVENAIKYNLPGGSVTVRVEARGEQSILSVADTGIGIPEADRPNIFNRFYRVDKARSREHGGSGLGLSIVHDAAALYGGTVTVDGVEPHGARFTVTFPRAAADDAPEAQKEVPET